MDKIGQEINLGDFVMVMRNGSGWDSKVTYFSLGVVTRLTEKMAYIGNPEDNTKIKHEKLLVLTEEQMRCWVNNDSQSIAEADERLYKLYDQREMVI